jgi:hypothetical protein
VTRHHLHTLNTSATANKISVENCANSLNDVKAELFYLNNSNVANCASHSLLQANTHHQTTHGKIDASNTLLTTQGTHNTNLLAKNSSIYSELAYANNTGASGSLAHSGVQILAKNTELETLITTANTYGINHNVSSQNSATHTALIDNGAFTANTYTTTIDLLVSGTTEIYRDVTIYGKYDDATSPHFHFAYSDDDSNYFIDPIYHAESITDGTYKHFRMSYENIPFRYVRIYNDTTASTTATYLYWVALKHR